MMNHTFEIRSGDYRATIKGKDPFKSLINHWKTNPPLGTNLGMLVLMKRDTPDETGETTWYASTTVVLAKAGYDVSKINSELGALLEMKHKKRIVTK